MRKNWKRIFAVIISMVSIFSMVSLGGQTVNAASENYPDCWGVVGAVHIYDANSPTPYNIPADLQFTIESGEHIEALKTTILTHNMAYNVKNIKITFIYAGVSHILDSSYFTTMLTENKDVDIEFDSEKLVTFLGSLQIEETLKVIVDFEFDTVAGITPISGRIIINNGSCPILTTLVTPLQPILSSPDCDQKPIVILPEILGVEYIVEETADSYVITAIASNGFVLESSSEWRWMLPYSTEQCPVNPEPGILPETGSNQLIFMIFGSALLIVGAITLISKK